MQTRRLGAFGDVSRLVLGGGGIGQVWGATSGEEAKATLWAAVDAGITLIDAAPMYGSCEALIGETFEGRPPAGLRFTSKCQLGSPPRGAAAARLAASAEASLAAMRLPRLDLFFLHSNICADDYVYARRAEMQDQFATRWSIYVDEVIPAMEGLVQAGKIGAWGLTGTGVPETIIRALNHARKPAAVQAIANLLDSAGGIRSYAEPARPRDIIAAAADADVGVLGIRAVQAGALTDAIDRELSPRHPDRLDYERASPFRALCAELGVKPAMLAHRYALAMPGVDAVVLGVKNRAELDDCLAAEAEALDPAVAARIDALGLREPA
ncbi:MAG TPA: aldo/keto reductase [Caulobacteraceae bacterium]|nr:aldo/keto reductase [Caulobacteraceae bacterium]